MKIRSMKEEDLDQVVALEQAVFSQPWSRESFEAELAAAGHCYLVAEEEGQILGYCGYCGVTGEGQIYNVAVKKEARNQGIGRQMLKALLQSGRVAGIEDFTLEVRIGNQPDIHLYQSLGFETAGIRKAFYQKPTEDALIMWRYGKK